MSEFDDLLAQLEGGEGGGSEAFTSLRNHAKQLEKELKDERKARSTTEARVAELEQAQRAGTAKSLFSSLGIKPELAELFLATKPEDVSEESAKTWAQKYGFVSEQPPAPTGEETPPEPQGSPQPPPVVGTEAQTQKMKMPEWYRLYKTNPARAMQLAGDGLVDGLDSTSAFGDAAAMASL